ncbi:hypothetical protein AXG93_4689s1140 [Marchantia polymorpha subsp. ruderalis]|uniref:Bulb-type lectin domain-containing protein n=1 Tax=Marchantia polymorpha subsp. ruderalis TaxID=1480154 RepID=A0A176WKF7_MARPO|nr:hypothetical protein AXG93_4689s1140 [Marchantia polymorpha subsp. ruderalis]
MAERWSRAVVWVWVLMVMLVRCGEAYDSVLLEGFYLAPKQEIVERPFSLKMQSDCNLVLYANNVRPVWATDTMNQGEDCYFLLQADGDGVIWTGDGRALWRTNTAGMNNGPHFIKMQCDGNVVMYTAVGYPLWATDTNVSILSLADRQRAYNASHADDSSQASSFMRGLIRPPDEELCSGAARTRMNVSV